MPTFEQRWKYLPLNILKTLSLYRYIIEATQVPQDKLLPAESPTFNEKRYIPNVIHFGDNPFFLLFFLLIFIAFPF